MNLFRQIPLHVALAAAIGIFSLNASAQEEVLDSDAVEAVENAAAEAEEAETPAKKMTPEEQEAAAVAKQLEEQKIARWAVPLISGFALGGLDPESPQDSGIVVLDGGRAGLAEGTLNVNGGNYQFNGANLVPENAGWTDVPFNKFTLLAIFKWIALSAVLGWPFVAFVLRGTMYTNEKHDASSGSHFWKFLGWVVNLLVLLTMGALFLLSVRRPELWTKGPMVELSHVFPLVAGLAVTAILGLIGSLLAWSKGYWRIPGRLHYTVTIISALVFVWYLNQTGVLRHLIENNL